MTTRRLFAVLLGTMVALDAAVVLVRIADVLSFGRLVIFPAEGPVLYAVWKLRHGHPLYEWPMAPPFTLTVYNFLFYETYAFALEALRVPDAAMPVAGRFITLASALAGAACQFAAARRLFRSSRPPALLVASLAVITWIGAGFPGWWTFSIRPDVPATALAAAGVWAAAIASTGGRRWWLAAAGIAFLCAWCFKQSDVGLFVATCLYVIVVRRSMRELAWLAAPFASGVALAFLIGGASYRANIITMPALNKLVMYLPVHWYRSIAVTDALPWAISGFALVVWLRRVMQTRAFRSLTELPGLSRELFGLDLTYLLLATLATFALSLVLLAKVGAAINHALEFHVAASLLCTGVLAGGWRAGGSRLQLAAAVSLVPMIAFTALMMGGREHGTVATALQLKVWGDSLHLGRRTDLVDRAELIARIDNLPAPIYWEDETFPPPWRAWSQHYPGTIVDHITYDDARRLGMIDTGIDGLFRQHYYGAAVLTDSSEYLAVAIRAGYRVTDTFRPAWQPNAPLRLVVRGE